MYRTFLPCWGRIFALGLGLGTGLFWAPAPAQSRRGPKAPIRAFAVTDLAGNLVTVGQYRTRDEQPKTGDKKRKSTEATLEGNLRLGAKGYFYHPNLIEFHVSGLFGYQQRNFDITGAETQSESTNGMVGEFDLGAKILKRKKYPTSLYGRRVQEWESRAFQASEYRTTTEYGLQWLFISPKIPVQLSFDSSDILFERPDDPEDRQHVDRQIRLDTGYNFSADHSLSLGLEHEITSDEPFAISTDSDEVSLGHLWGFGETKQHRLASSFLYYNQRGAFSTQRMQLNEQLQAQWLDSLRSRFRINLEDRAQGSSAGGPRAKERSYYFSGDLQHRLYQSLVSEIHGFGLLQELNQTSGTNQYGAGARLDYRKKNPFGRLFLNLGADLQQTSRGGENQRVPTIDAKFTFNDPDPIIINDPDVLLSTIVLTNEAGNKVFLVDLDYLVRAFANRIEIHRVPTGDIADGQTVLVDYSVLTVSGFDLSTRNFTFGARQRFRFGLSPYYSFSMQQQSVSSADPDATAPEDITAQVLGLEFLRGPFSLLGEYELYDSSTNPSTSIRASGGFFRRFSYGTSVALNASYSAVDYSSPSREATYLSVRGQCRQSLFRSIVIGTSAEYRVEEDSLIQNTKGIDADLSFEWTIRQTQLLINLEFSQFDNSQTSNSSATIYIQLRRDF